MGTALDTLKKWSSLLEYNLPNLGPREIGSSREVLPQQAVGVLV
jgi:hypothetical protein